MNKEQFQHDISQATANSLDKGVDGIISIEIEQLINKYSQRIAFLIINNASWRNRWRYPSEQNIEEHGIEYYINIFSEIIVGILSNKGIDNEESYNKIFIELGKLTNFDFMKKEPETQPVEKFKRGIRYLIDSTVYYINHIKKGSLKIPNDLLISQEDICYETQSLLNDIIDNGKKEESISKKFKISLIRYLNCKYLKVIECENNIFIVQGFDGRFGFINQNNGKSTECIYDFGESNPNIFENGVCKIYDGNYLSYFIDENFERTDIDNKGNKKYGTLTGGTVVSFLDKNGKIIKEIYGINCSTFSEGKIAIYRDEVAVFINENFEVEGTIDYDRGKITLEYIYPFKNGMAQVLGLINGDIGSSENIIIGYINDKYEFIIPFQYSDASDFDNYGFAIVSTKEERYKKFLINKKGKEYKLGYETIKLSDKENGIYEASNVSDQSKKTYFKYNSEKDCFEEIS